MNKLAVHSAYFIGIGGIGMSALANYMIAFDVPTFGYDKTASPITKELETKGASIVYNDDPALINNSFLQMDKQSVMVIYTPAIPSDQKILTYFQENGFQVIKRSDALAFILKGMRTLAVAGTHGKTTTSTILAHILKESVGCNAFLGGVSNNFNSNFHLDKSTDLVVVEADEYDRSFLKLKPFMSIITSVEADHLDIYQNPMDFEKAFKEFAGLTSNEGLLVKHTSVKIEIVSLEAIKEYGAGSNRVENLRIEDGKFYFDMVIADEKVGDILFRLPGNYNALNALAASLIAVELGVGLDQIKTALESYRGVKRRFEYIVNRSDRVFIDDYAHHPGELHAIISAVKSLYPKKTILGVFQPHLFSRTRDFMDGFASALGELDELILLDIYPARELPIDNVDSNVLLDKVPLKKKRHCTKQELVNQVRASTYDILLTLGAGDIDRLVEPLRKGILNETSIQS